MNSLPEQMNNYNLPPQEIIDQKLKILSDYYPTFANKSEMDLKDLLKYNDLFQTHFDGLEQVQMTRTLQYELRQQSLQLAEANLELQKRVAKLRHEATAKEAELRELSSEFVEYSNKQVEKQREFFKRGQITKLIKKRDSLETESELIVDEFLNPVVGTGGLKNEQEISNFLSEFIKKRTNYHLLAAKHELIMKNNLL
ncbi:Vacuolar protein-sorting-associated protein 37-like protein [Smittium mucronatum]|uniref:Vacuolar protein-sorting-associated protein 37-like protein n=1 Tax=Smittium mucronatum TaxID=133383 RepID=A0A1R0H8F4_9FUNG|nr:Vacuolar protein-sorting-associated protein 37-like protein [Smittium mucronatum]